MNRRKTQAYITRERRTRWFDRRRHTGPFRWLWIPVGMLARRAASAVLGIF